MTHYQEDADAQLEAKVADGDESAQNPKKEKEKLYLQKCPPSVFFKVRSRVAAAFQTPSCQACFAAVVFFNFTAKCFETQMLPAKDTLLEKVFYVIEITCTCVYILELLINLFASGLWDFVSSPWAWFDVVVITASVASFFGVGPAGTHSHTHTHTQTHTHKHTNTQTNKQTHKHTHTNTNTNTNTNTHTGVNVLRLLGVFRVLRVLERLGPLNTIATALYTCLPSMINAIALTVMVLAMYTCHNTVLGVTSSY
jgi:hypothetical protein